MQRIYYQIDETTAKRAHSMMSFRDYPEGSKTAEYKRYVDRAYDLADEAVKARPDEEERIYRYAERYSRKVAENMNAASRIGCMCPSVMISGAGNFPVKKKEKQNRAFEKNHAEWNEIQKILDKINSIVNGKEIIKAGDADAVEKLEEKLEKLKARQEHMKAVNSYYRKNKTLEGCTELTEGQRKELESSMKSSWHYEDKPYQSFELSNNNQRIHATEKRLLELAAAKSRENAESGNELFRVVENTEIMRLQIFFDGKPEANVREVLKSNGFRWSPRNSCWQRQLNSNGRTALARVVKILEV